jgi:hypothetical protein
MDCFTHVFSTLPYLNSIQRVGMVSSSWHDTKTCSTGSCLLLYGTGHWFWSVYTPPIQKFKRVSLDRNGCNTKQRENSLAFSSSLMPFVPILQSVQQVFLASVTVVIKSSSFGFLLRIILSSLRAFCFFPHPTFLFSDHVSLVFVTRT